MVSHKSNKFSPKYRTFEDWLKSQDTSKPYVQRILKGHSRYPNASLSQLRGHASKGKKPVSELKEIPVYKRGWSSINNKELIIRQKSLEVLSKVRHGESLTRASKELKISPKAVIKNTNAFRKIRGKWIPKKFDKISRLMSIYENGKQEWIEINDSRTASKIGKYNNAVKEFLITGNEDVFKDFTKTIRDSQGNIHYFETNPKNLLLISETIEEPEFYEIYKI